MFKYLLTETVGLNCIQIILSNNIIIFLTNDPTFNQAYVFISLFYFNVFSVEMFTNDSSSNSLQ